MKKTHRLGLGLWRGGLLLVVGYVAYDRIRAVLAIADDELEFAVSIFLVGLLFVLISVVMEQVADARAQEASE